MLGKKYILQEDVKTHLVTFVSPVIELEAEPSQFPRSMRTAVKISANTPVGKKLIKI